MAGMMSALVLFLILAVVFPFQTSASRYTEPDGTWLREIHASSIKDCATVAKDVVDRAFTEARNRFKISLRESSFSARDLMAFFRQPAGNTRNALRAAEKREEILNLLGIFSEAYSSQNFNLTDKLSHDDLDTLSKESGCDSETLPQSCPRDETYRDITGACNNRANPSLGASDRAFARWLPAQYEDGISLPRGWNEGREYSGHPLPLVRDVSNQIASFLDESGIFDQDRAYMFMQWGQWIDHDLDLSPGSPVASPNKTSDECAASCSKEANCFPIMIPAIDPMGTKRGKCIAFFRTGPACPTDTVVREQLNALTSFIDAGMVYGSRRPAAASLRNMTNQLGLLSVNQRFTDGERPFLPFNNNTNSPCAATNSEFEIPCFVAGDQRASESLGLMAMHTLFMREHNRLARKLKQLNPLWDGEKVYQETRKIVGAMMQIITFRDYLPLVLGDRFKEEIPNYTGYDKTADPRVANIFSIAFRFGHSTIPPYVVRLDSEYKPLLDNVPLHNTFFATWRLVEEGGVDPVLRGILAQEAKLMQQDKMVTDEVREKLFERPPKPGIDLVSFNLQRGRDHGLPGYNSWRRFCDLSTPKNLTALTAVMGNGDLARKFLDMYKTPDNIDIWIGGIAEPFVEGGRVGPLLACLIGRQFRLIRDGDRFWWQNPGVFSAEQRNALSRISLPQIVCANTGITQVPRDVFRANAYPRDFVSCDELNTLDLKAWEEIIEM